ncbi:hypothetical protein QAD02_003864 [Eretmocerus hayati]|uniref:Uncharacterized protein n=1 Tax=Eretmocerus hayati TaxID=131215 RepID=A0ACC2NN54_9HYME|nr:hypothetical protein QAD02_003864 [Eretmocerus hayati]
MPVIMSQQAKRSDNKPITPYQQLNDAAKVRFVDSNPAQQQEKANQIREGVKRKSKSLAERQTNVDDQVKIWNEQITRRKNMYKSVHLHVSFTIFLHSIQTNNAVYVVTNPPGRSCFNPVERRMAPLSHELAGVILPHNSFGNHLDGSKKTIDRDLERKNFEEAGEVLCDIWNSLIVDGYGVRSQYVKDELLRNLDEGINHIWYAKYVRGSQYLLRIADCASERCCGPRRSNLWSVLPTGFLPPPMKIRQTQINDPNDPSGKFMPLFVQLAVDITHNAPKFQHVKIDKLLEISISFSICLDSIHF